LSAFQLKNYLKDPSYLAFIVGLVLGLYFITFSVVGFDFAFFPGDFIDGRFNNYILEHAHLFFTGQISEFWNAPFMFPEKDVITYSDNLLGTAPFYSVFRLLGFDRETSFQAWYILITILNYSAAYFLLNYIFRNKYAAVSGAMIFAFSLALHSQMAHAQTYTRFPMLLTLLFALLFEKDFQIKWFFLTVLAVVYQMYCGIYLGFLLMFPAGILMLSIFITNWTITKEKIKNRKWLLQMLIVLLVNVLLLLPLMLPYFKRALSIGFYDYNNIVHSIPSPLSYFSSWVGSLFWDGLRETTISYPAFWDHLIFAGALGTIGILFFLFIQPIIFFKKQINIQKNENKYLKLLWIAAIFTFLFFLRFNQISMYRVLFTLPGYGSMRALQRIINFELIFFAIGLAYLVKSITQKKSLTSLTIFLLIAVLIIADNYVKPDFTHHRNKLESQNRINVLIEKMKCLPKGSIVSYEPDSLLSSPMDYHLDAMMAAQFLGLKTLNGYSATSPGGYGDYWVKPDERSRNVWLERNELKDLEVTTIK